MKPVFLFFLLLSSFCFSQNEKTKQLDTLFDLLFSKHKMMGSIVVTESGKTIYNNSIGYQYFSGSDSKMSNENSKYRIGSITKIFTAVMIFQLIDENKLNLEDKLSKYYPEIPNAANISIANLLNHSSGLYNITRDPDFSNWMLKPTTHNQMLSRIKKHKIDFQAGQNTAYSNTNFILLGYILETIEKKTYKKLLKDRIVDPLKLDNTYYGNEINIHNNECQSYYYENETLKQATETDMSNPGGAGSIVSTPSDLVIFMNALFNHQLISKTSFKKMTYSKNDIGSGIHQITRNGEAIFGHNGSIDGFKAFTIYVPKKEMALAITTNGLNYNLMQVLFNTYDFLNGKSLIIPSFENIELSSHQIKAYEGVYENEKLPFDLMFVADGKILKGGPNLQQLYKLKAVKQDEFSLEAEGVTIKFNTDKTVLHFTDPTKGDTPIVFTKKQ